MIYALIIVIGVVLYFLAYFIGKKDEEIDELNQRYDDLYIALSSRSNADIDGLRKKYKRDSL